MRFRRIQPALSAGRLERRSLRREAVSADDFAAVGVINRNSATLIQQWIATSWSQVSSPDPNAHIGYNLAGIAAISTNDIWAAGTAGIENWNGTSWSIVSAIPSGVSAPDGVAVLSDGTVVVVGENGGILRN
jgi:photosystem II stability/assembly factor-like uncharacterized protein